MRPPHTWESLREGSCYQDRLTLVRGALAGNAAELGAEQSNTGSITIPGPFQSLREIDFPSHNGNESESVLNHTRTGGS